MAKQSQCCICGRILPNRYAVAGTCRKEECHAVFCHLHWRQGNQLCLVHGYQERGNHDGEKTQFSSGKTIVNENDISLEDASMRKESQDDASRQAEEGRQSALRCSPALAKKLMKATLHFVSQLGGGAISLLNRLKKDKSPEAMLSTLNEAMQGNQQRRAICSENLSQQNHLIISLKQAYAAASPARKRLLESELKSALAQYKAIEREMQVLLENEQVLAAARGRIHEMEAYALAGVNDDLLDELALQIDERADAAESRQDAARDLEKAGRRRHCEGDSEKLWEELSGFEEAVSESGGEPGIIEESEKAVKSVADKDGLPVREPE